MRSDYCQVNGICLGSKFAYADYVQSTRKGTSQGKYFTRANRNLKAIFDRK